MSSEAKLKNGRRRGSAEGRAIAEDLTAHSAFSKEALDKITQTHGLIEVSDFQDDLQSFAGKFIVLTVGFYIFMTLYYYSQLHWTVVNSLYFSIVTFSTCGYGDKLPHTDTQRMFTAMWIIIGIAATSNLIGVVSAISKEQAKREQLDLRNAVARKQLNQHDKLDEDVINGNGGHLSKALQHVDAHVRRLFDVITFYNTFLELLEEDDDLHDNIAKLRLKYFKELQNLRYQIFLDLCVLVVIVLFSTIFMSWEEKWSSYRAFYWSVVTVSTVGYGDFTPTYDGSKLYTCFYVLVGGFYFIKVVTGAVAVPIKMLALKNEIRVLRQFEVNLTEDKFDHIVHHPLFTSNANLRRSVDDLSKSEFVIALLNMMNKLDDEDVAVAGDIFDAIDATGDGVLSRRDLDGYKPAAISVAKEEMHQREEYALANPISHLIRGVSTRGSFSFSGKRTLKTSVLQHIALKKKNQNQATLANVVSTVLTPKVEPETQPEEQPEPEGRKSKYEIASAIETDGQEGSNTDNVVNDIAVVDV